MNATRVIERREAWPRLGRGLALAALLLLGAPGAALAGPPDDRAASGSRAHNPHLVAALKQIEAGRINEAEALLGRAMAWPRNDNRTLVEIYRNLAVVHFYGGKEDEAYQDFARILNIDLHYVLPTNTAVPLRKLYERVQAAYRDGLLKPIRVAHDPPLVALPSSPVTVAATVSNLKEGFDAVLLYRRMGETKFTELPLQRRPGDRFATTVPPQSLPAGERELLIEYYLEVRDARGRRVQGRGSALSPLSYLIEAPGGPQAPSRAPRWYKNPWLWTVLGGVAVGATVGGIAASRGPRTGTLPLTITVGP